MSTSFGDSHDLESPGKKCLYLHRKGSSPVPFRTKIKMYPDMGMGEVNCTSKKTVKRWIAKESLGEAEIHQIRQIYQPAFVGRSESIKQLKVSN